MYIHISCQVERRSVGHRGRPRLRAELGPRGKAPRDAEQPLQPSAWSTPALRIRPRGPSSRSTPPPGSCATWRSAGRSRATACTSFPTLSSSVQPHRPGERLAVGRLPHADQSLLRRVIAVPVAGFTSSFGVVLLGSQRGLPGYPAQSSPRRIAAQIGAHLRGHLLQFDRRTAPALTADAGARLLLTAALLEVLIGARTVSSPASWSARAPRKWPDRLEMEAAPC
jgi:hypothetical protein